MSVDQPKPGTDRRHFLRRTAATGAGVLVGASALDVLIPSFAAAKSGGVTSGDVAIVGAAQIAEALAVTTYTNIINQSPFFKRLPEDDQGYLKAARQEEMSHYALEMSVTGKPSPFTTFYYPPQDVLRRPDDPRRARHARGRVHRRVSRRGPRLQHPRPARARGADHGHRERPPHARARPRPATCPPRTADRSRRSPASRARPRASIRPTTTGTSARSSGRRSARRSRL